MNKASITVNYKLGDDGRAYFDIQVPKDQRGLGVDASTMMLSAAIALLIKAGHNRGDIKDHELLDKVVTYLESEFISNDSFNDATIHPNTIKSE